MIATKYFSLKRILQFTGHHMIWIILWSTFAVVLYHYSNLNWLQIPWLPLSLIGTAVAFYLGFKNNSAYDRMWEARKIWGAIVNSSRSWGMYVRAFVTNQFADLPLPDHQLHDLHKKLIYRHIGWLYTLRNQLLVIAPWENPSLKGPVGKMGRLYRDQFGIGLVKYEFEQVAMEKFFPSGELKRLSTYKNMATQIIDQQSSELTTLREQGLIEDFRHMELQTILKDFYDHQGKCERIKKFPLPRQYGNMSMIFVGIFVFLLPFGMITEFSKLGDWAIWFSIPFTALVSWIYVVMEIVGDYSENPFQGMANDIPMLNLCRVIETDLREMLGEIDLPPAIEARNGILM